MDLHFAQRRLRTNEEFRAIAGLEAAAAWESASACNTLRFDLVKPYLALDAEYISHWTQSKGRGADKIAAYFRRRWGAMPLRTYRAQVVLEGPYPTGAPAVLVITAEQDCPLVWLEQADGLIQLVEVEPADPQDVAALTELDSYPPEC